MRCWFSIWLYNNILHFRWDHSVTLSRQPTLFFFAFTVSGLRGIEKIKFRQDNPMDMNGLKHKTTHNSGLYLRSVYFAKLKKQACRQYQVILVFSNLSFVSVMSM